MWIFRMPEGLLIVFPSLSAYWVQAERDYIFTFKDDWNIEARRALAVILRSGILTCWLHLKSIKGNAEWYWEQRLHRWWYDALRLIRAWMQNADSEKTLFEAMKVQLIQWLRTTVHKIYVGYSIYVSDLSFICEMFMTV